MIDFLLSALVLFILVLVVYLVLQLLSASTDTLENPDKSKIDLSDVVVLVPAHNEEGIIEATLQSLIVDLPSRQVLVVADNCTDATASIAAQCGAQVIERNHDTDKGKGFALEFGIQHLQNQPKCPEVLVIIDADCLVQANALSALITRCVETGRPVQALYLMRSRNNASARIKIAEFAWIIKNQVRPMGSERWGMPCQLMGTGMAFPFELLSKLNFGTAHIVEDMKLGIDCALKGFPPVFCPEALVESTFPEDDAGLKSQRTRWEHGHLGMIFSEASGFLKSAILNKQKFNLAMGLDLIVPPLAFLILILLSLLLTGAGLFFFLRRSGEEKSTVYTDFVPEGDVYASASVTDIKNFLDSYEKTGDEDVSLLNASVWLIMLAEGTVWIQ